MIVDGLHFKFLNQFYNKQIANIKKNNDQRSLGEKTEGWKESDRRIKCGLYRTANGTKINADANGASNICKKVAATLGLCLKGVNNGALITPLKVRIWAVQESLSF
ncbi:MAG: hypothetical protein HC789_19385 [Microcoleus sp. CSU_2_2]|nr:hypothetical protein [Microcoleus sp. SU_5_3]NJS12380.1 hypothetical protein [Microcoleus sp. CSU_2_2]